MRRLSHATFLLALALPALGWAQQPQVIAVSADASCADRETTEAFAEAVRQQLHDALVIVADAGLPPHDTAVHWGQTPDGCALDVRSGGTSARLDLDAMADEAALHQAAVRVAWLAELQAGQAFGGPAVVEAPDPTSEASEPAPVAATEVIDVEPEPDVVEPGVIESDPEEVDPDSEPEVIEPEVVAPEAIEPEVIEPEVIEPDPDVVEVVAEEPSPGASASAPLTLYPVGVTLIPGIDFPAGSGAGAKRELSLGLFSATGAVDGFEFTLLAGFIQGDLNGVQVSSGGNMVAGRMNGVQAAAGFNLANEMDGLQAGPVNILATGGSGFQAGVVNIAGSLDGFQAGVVNVADEANLEAGVVNVADEAEVQVGLVNVARSSDLSIGLVSVVLDEPVNLYAALDADAVTSVGVRHGSRHFQTILEFQAPIDARPNRLGGGFGGRIPLGALWLELDALVLGVFALPELASGSPPVYGEARLTLGWQIARRLAVFGGLTQNVYWASSLADADYVGMETTPYELDVDSFLWTFPGARLGVRF